MSIGKTLRDKREEKKLSLEDVSAATRVNKKYIQALEDENFLLIPSHVYAKGFLKACSELLGLDTRALLGELANYYKSRDERGTAASSARKIPVKISMPKLPKMPRLPAIPKVPQLPKMDLNKQGVHVLAFLLIILFVILAASGQVSFKRKRAVLIKTNPPAAIKTKAAVKPAPKKAVAVKTQASNTKESVAANGKVQISLVITGKSLLQVTAGTKELYNGTPGVGSKMRFIGKEIKIKAGNGGAVKVFLNGDFLGLMGADGAIAERTFKAPQ